MEQADNSELLGFTTDIVSAHLSNNQVNTDEIPSLIKTVYGTLADIATDALSSTERPQPAVPIKRSVTPDYIICLEDGKKLKMLKRHLKTAYNMTPDEYREKWGLSPEYPMVAPNYAEKRSKLAKDIGLGTHSNKGDA
jgi:predicted transcriptional regulator